MHNGIGNYNSPSLRQGRFVVRVRMETAASVILWARKGGLGSMPKKTSWKGFASFCHVFTTGA